MRRIPVLLVTCALVTLGTVSTSAVPGSPGGACLPGDVLENDDVRIWFQGLRGHIQVFDKRGPGNDGGVYSYRTDAVKEVDEEGTLATLDLLRAHPQASDCTVEEDDEWLNVSFSVTESVRAANGMPVGTATATFVYHFNKTSQGAKFDLYVDDWPWRSDASELAFDFTVHSTYTMEAAENGIGFRDGDDSKGYIEWAMEATARYDDGSQATAIVDSETTLTGGSADVRLRFTNVTAGYVELEYDPWIGVGEYVIIGGFLVGLAPVQALVPAPLRPVTDPLRQLL